MSKKVLTILTVLIVVLAAVGLVMAEGNALPGSGWKSGQQIQNVGAANASIVFQAYGQNGAAYNCGTKPAGPGASVNFLTDTDCTTVPAGFVGSAVVSADQPIAAIVNVNNRGVGNAAGQYRGTDGADVANTIAFPLVKNNFGGRTTTFYVQNASGNTNNVNASFRVGANSYTKSFSNVPANAMVVISPADAGVPNNAVGSLTVTGSQPLAGTSLEHEASVAVANNMQASRAFTPNDYDQTAYCPLVRNAHTANGMTTGIQAQNVSSAAQTVSVKYSYSIGGGALQSKTVTSPSLAAGESFTFFQGDGTYGVPAGALGSATVTGSGGNIAVVVNDRAFALTGSKTRVTTYSCFAGSSATPNVVLPLYKELFGGNTTGIQVQNVGSSATTVQATFLPTGGAPKTFTSPTIQPGASHTFFGMAGLGNTFGGVTLSASQPIVAMANESSFGAGASGQDTKNYEGFNQ
ncbi:MAG: hypothetical protein LC131_01215 [Anaerolineae bacterium]|nr:hypothetical protein [Anaerolineae bacterium]